MNLDVITLMSESTPKQYVPECLRSIKLAADLASYPVNPIQSPGVPGHIGQAMRKALERSSGEYVAFVDDDDFVLPNAFECLAPHFASAPAAICARELQLMANGRLIPNHVRHHLTAYAREVLEVVDLESWPAFVPPALQIAALVIGPVVDVMQWVYVYRRRRSAGLALRAVHGG